jgi:hypothetical protein
MVIEKLANILTYSQYLDVCEYCMVFCFKNSRTNHMLNISGLNTFFVMKYLNSCQNLSIFIGVTQN